MTKEFECPKCDSNYFGTIDCVNWIKPKGHCHGEGCDFTWCRLTEGDNVFIGPQSEVSNART